MYYDSLQQFDAYIGKMQNYSYSTLNFSRCGSRGKYLSGNAPLNWRALKAGELRCQLGWGMAETLFAPTYNCV